VATEIATLAAALPTWTTWFGSGGLTDVVLATESTSSVIERDSAAGRSVDAQSRT
jgi:hypothetical protein